MKKTKTAVLVPCYNEETTVNSVVADFHRALPEAEIYVYDNNSTDHTADVARAAGAIVRTEPLQGKGNVVRRMFADIEAEVYVLVDGDSTYSASCAPRMIHLLIDSHEGKGTTISFSIPVVGEGQSSDDLDESV